MKRLLVSLVGKGLSQPLASRGMGRRTSSLFTHGLCHIASYGRVTDEDRRWWKLHLESHPDVTLGTFVSFLDNCGEHTTKRLIESNIWTIEQVSMMTEEEVEIMKNQQKCTHIDIVWEHARAIAPELRKRELGGEAASDELQKKVLELRKKRELEKRKQEILEKRAQEVENREDRIGLLKEEIAKKREELKKRQQAREQANQTAGIARPRMGIAEAMKTENFVSNNK